jgi:hypothetical protein
MASLSAVAKAKNPSATQVSACGWGSTLLSGDRMNDPLVTKNGC